MSTPISPPPSGKALDPWMIADETGETIATIPLSTYGKGEYLADHIVRMHNDTRRWERQVESLIVGCIDLVPGIPSPHADPRVWRCRICETRGEYPGFKHTETCPVRALHNPV